MADGEVSRSGRVRDFVASRSGAQQIGAVPAILVLLSAPFGGLDSVSEQSTVPLALNQKLDIGAFYVTIDSVKQRASLPPVIEDFGDGSRLLVVRVEVENHSARAETARMVQQAFSGTGTGALPWSEDAPPELRMYDVNDAVEVPTGEFVNPGQTYDWALVLRQRGDVDLDDLELAVTGYQFEEIDTRTTLDEDYWVPDDQPLAEGHVEVEIEDEAP